MNLYGTTSSDTQASAMLTCRQISKTIVDYGVSDKDILTIIRLMAFELENHDHCVALVEVLKELGNSHFILEESTNGKIG